MRAGTEGPHPASPPPPSCAGIARQLGGDLAASVLLVCAALKAAAVGAVALGLGASRGSLLLPDGWEPFCLPPPPPACGIAKRLTSRC